MNLTVQPPDQMPNIELTSLVREATTRLITIENPLPQEVTIKKEMITIDNDNVSVQPSSFKIPPKSEFGFEVVFRPLISK